MRSSRRLNPPLVVLALLLPLAAGAAEFKKSEECRPGIKVTDRSDKAGTVTGVSNGMCQVRFADGTQKSYLHWMLRPAGESRITADKLVPGTYPCYSSGNYLFMDVVIDNADSYRDKKGSRGKYRLDPASAKIVFESGPLKDVNAKLFNGPKIGLNMKGGNVYNTTCGLKK